MCVTADCPFYGFFSPTPLLITSRIRKIHDLVRRKPTDMAFFDELAEKIGDDQWDEWKKRVLATKEEMAAFVASRQSDVEPKSSNGSKGLSTSASRSCTLTGLRIP